MLELRNVSKVAGGVDHIRDVSLTLQHGSLNVLLGPTLSGKTSLMRLMAGLDRPTAGSVWFDGKDMTGVRVQDRNVAMVYQQFINYPAMTVYENIASPLRVAGAERARIDKDVRRAAEMLKLTPYLDRLPLNLSGGQQQRTALARAIVKNASLVLLDEPLANLDRHLRQEMEETFREFHARSGATMIYVTHDQAEAMALATDVAVMSEGRLLQVATPEEIYARPEGRLVGGLVGQGAILSWPAASVESRSLDWETLQRLLSHSNGADCADILVRPQDIEIAGDGMPATVTSVLFEGERYALKLALGDDQPLRAFSRHPVRVGDAVSIVIRSAWKL